jgi:hypothetical protein
VARVLKPAGRRLKAENLGPNWSAKARIRDVTFEQIGDDRKPVLYFENQDKGLVLNATNIDALVAIFGTDESEAWIGHVVELFTTGTTFQGRQTLGIRVRAVPTSSGRPPLPPPPRPREPGDDDDAPSPFTSRDIKW